MKKEEVKKKEGESLTDYIRRLETLQDTTRCRVPADMIDKEGNVIAQPVMIYGVDDTGTPAELVSSYDGFLKVAGGNRPSGTLYEVIGYINNGEAGNTTTDGYITPAAGDEFTILYGSMSTQTYAAGGAVQAFVFGGGSNRWKALLVNDAGAAADEYWFFPSTGTVASGPNNLSLLPPGGLILKHGYPGTAAGEDSLWFTATQQAQNEKLYFDIVGVSRDGTYPTLAAGTNHTIHDEAGV